MNYIIPQISKCKFIVVNGIQSDGTPLPFSASILDNVGHLEILGSHFSFTGILQDGLELHTKKRYVSCIKFYNFCRENRLAPLSVKIKVLKACVMGSLQLRDVRKHGAVRAGDCLPQVDTLCISGEVEHTCAVVIC